MLLRKFRTHINQPFPIGKGPPLVTGLFGWLIPKSKTFDATVLACDGGAYMYVRLNGRRDVLVSRSFEHPDTEPCDNSEDPECGHWRPAKQYAIGDPAKVKWLPPMSSRPQEVYFDVSDGNGNRRAAAAGSPGRFTPQHALAGDLVA